MVLRELLKELKLRWRRPFNVKQKEQSPKAPHVVILSEWDTPYGRSLNVSFVAQASHRTLNEVIEEHPRTANNTDQLLVREADAKTERDQGGKLLRVHSYRYLRGIDGQLPGDPTKETPHDQIQKNQVASDAVAIEATEGSQSVRSSQAALRGS